MVVLFLSAQKYRNGPFGEFYLKDRAISDINTVCPKMLGHCPKYMGHCPIIMEFCPIIMGRPEMKMPNRKLSKIDFVEVTLFKTGFNIYEGYF